MLASSFSDSCFVDSVGDVSLVTSIFSNSYTHNPSSCLLWDSPDLLGKEVNGDFQLRLSFCLMSGCGSLYPLTSGGGKILFCDDWTRHQSMSIAEIMETFHWFFFLFIFILFSSCIWFYSKSINYDSSYLGHASSVGHGLHLIPWTSGETNSGWLLPLSPSSPLPQPTLWPGQL